MYFNNQVLEAVNCVTKLNDIYFDCTNDEENLPFTVIIAEPYIRVEFLNILMWDNQDYDGDYTKDEEGDLTEDREPIYTTVIRRTKEFMKTLKKLKL